MQPAERPLRREKPRLKERLAQVTYLDQYRPTHVASDFKDIDFDTFQDKKGNRVNTLLLDFDGTCVPYNGWDVDPEIVQKIKDAKFEHIAIITNSKVKDERSLTQFNWWAKQIGADIVFTPTEGDRKPSPVMLLKALQHFGATPDQALMVGDKLTADIAAANYAGVKSVHVNRLGEQDLEGDKYIRRPAEKVIFKRVKGRMGKMQRESNAGNVVASLDATLIQEPVLEEDVPEWVTDDVKPLWDASVVEGFSNKPKTVLPQEVKDAIPPGIAQVGIGKIRGILGEVNPEYIERFDKFMYEHGRKVATVATLSRIPGALLVAHLIMTDHPRAAQLTHLFFALTDGVDGWAARKSKKGATKWGGNLDTWIDKFFSCVVEEALIKKGYIKKIHRARSVRDVNQALVVRPIFSKVTGIEDTKAVFPGKVGTFSASAADNFSLTNTARKNPLINDLIQDFATGEKIYASPASVITWLEQDKLNKQAEASYQHAKQVLLYAA